MKYTRQLSLSKGWDSRQSKKSSAVRPAGSAAGAVGDTSGLTASLSRSPRSRTPGGFSDSPTSPCGSVVTVISQGLLLLGQAPACLT